MRAIVIPSSGSGPTLQELPRPEPQPGEVLIQVAASSVNGVDLYTARRAAEAEKFPVGLGKDFAGTVVATGRGVTRFSTGDRVFGWLAKPGTEGTFADYIAVPETLGIAAIA